MVATARPLVQLAGFHLEKYKAHRDVRRAVKNSPCIVYDICVVSGSGPADVICVTGVFPARYTRLIFLGDGSAPLSRTVRKDSLSHVGGKAQPAP